MPICLSIYIILIFLAYGGLSVLKPNFLVDCLDFVPDICYEN